MAGDLPFVWKDAGPPESTPPLRMEGRGASRRSSPPFRKEEHRASCGSSPPTGMTAIMGIAHTGRGILWLGD